MTVKVEFCRKQPNLWKGGSCYAEQKPQESPKVVESAHFSSSLPRRPAQNSHYRTFLEASGNQGWCFIQICLSSRGCLIARTAAVSCFLRAVQSRPCILSAAPLLHPGCLGKSLQLPRVKVLNLFLFCNIATFVNCIISWR